jgi:hypothetical protein
MCWSRSAARPAPELHATSQISVRPSQSEFVCKLHRPAGLHAAALDRRRGRPLRSPLRSSSRFALLLLQRQPLGRCYCSEELVRVAYGNCASGQRASGSFFGATAGAAHACSPETNPPRRGGPGDVDAPPRPLREPPRPFVGAACDFSRNGGLNRTHTQDRPNLLM